ncbi:hypothetical protein [Pontibacter populi]|uniref:Uncharacterized protein n=1 Tax=Pontibacter populi TaxID=890055 RepID=A0ABV1RWM0_9BACT
MRKLILSSLLFIVTLSSCETEKDELPQPSSHDYDINFQYDTPSKDIKDIELILSQENGTILLDTILASTKKHSLKVRTTDTKIYLTTIHYNASSNEYFIRTYVKVKAPTDWHIDEFADPSTATSQYERAKIIYNNLPPYDAGFHYMTRDPGSTRTSWSGSTLSIDYDKLLPTDVAYLLLPKYGKYILTELTSAQTTIDFSGSSNTIKQKYNRPAGASNYMIFLNGFLTAGNYSKPLNLYWPAIAASNEYDLQYPSKGIAEFDLQVQYTAADNSRHTYLYSGSTVPDDIDLAPKAESSVIKSGYDAFSIAFGQDKPSVYSTLWSFKNPEFNAKWIVYFSPDETNFAPEAFLANLKSQKLQGKVLSPGRLANTFTQKAPGYSYQAFLDYQANPDAQKKKEMKQIRKIGTYFN